MLAGFPLVFSLIFVFNSHFLSPDNLKTLPYFECRLKAYCCFLVNELGG